VPMTERLAASRSVVLRSGSLFLAISSTWDMVSWPTFSRPAVPVPFWIPAIFLIVSETGGFLRMNSKERSSKIVIMAGMTEPRISLVFSLNSLQKSMILMPWGPRAVPTGGAGLAEPA